MNQGKPITLRHQIPRAHPALAGHFPGNPIVPGVVILARVAAALPGFLGQPARITGFPSIKFIAPLAPEEAFEIALARRSEGQLTFEVLAAGGRIASGSIAYAIAE